MTYAMFSEEFVYGGDKPGREVCALGVRDFSKNSVLIKKGKAAARVACV